MSRNISYALSGWLAGVVTVFVLGFTWQYAFPAVVNVEHYYGDGPGLLAIIGIALLLVTPLSLIGGLIGGRISLEGGDLQQRLIAAVFGVIFTIPCGCVVLLYFTGWGFSIS